MFTSFLTMLFGYAFKCTIFSNKYLIYAPRLGPKLLNEDDPEGPWLCGDPPKSPCCIGNCCCCCCCCLRSCCWVADSCAGCGFWIFPWRSAWSMILALWMPIRRRDAVINAVRSVMVNKISPHHKLQIPCSTELLHGLISYGVQSAEFVFSCDNKLLIYWSYETCAFVGFSAGHLRYNSPVTVAGNDKRGGCILNQSSLIESARVRFETGA